MATRTITADRPLNELAKAAHAAEEVWLVDSNNAMGTGDRQEWLEQVRASPPPVSVTDSGAWASDREPVILQVVVDSRNETQLAMLREFFASLPL
jgi:hypothetical protein